MKVETEKSIFLVYKQPYSTADISGEPNFRIWHEKNDKNLEKFTLNWENTKRETISFHRLRTVQIH